MQKRDASFEAKYNYQSYALAQMVLHSPATEIADFSTLYENAEKQPNVIPTDQSLPAAGNLNDKDVKNKVVLSNLSGDDAGKSAEYVYILDRKRNDPEFRARHLRVIKNAMYEILENSLFKTEAYLTESKKFNCDLKLVIPEDFAKFGLDFLHYYYGVDKKSKNTFKKSKNPENDSITIIAHPEWINEEWLYWKSRNAENCNIPDDLEPPKSAMYYDLDSNTAFLLGVSSFEEIKKAVATISSNIAVKNKHGLPVFGNVKYIKATKNKKSSKGTFVTVSLYDTDKTYIGLSEHKEHLNKTDNSVFFSSGSLLLVTDQSGKKEGTVSMNEGMHVNAGDVPVSMFNKNPLLSAEDALITVNRNKKQVVFDYVEDLNSKVIVTPELFKTSGKERNADLPDYLSLCSRDELLPPVVAVKDAKLITAMYMSFFTRVLPENDMVFIPGGNPFRAWDAADEIPVLNKLIRKTRFKLLLINTGSFFQSSGNCLEISPDILDAIYPKILRQDIKWKEWSECPGMFLPQKGAFKRLIKDYDNHFNPSSISNKNDYYSLMLERMCKRLEVLETLNVPVEYRTSIHKITMHLSKII